MPEGRERYRLRRNMGRPRLRPPEERVAAVEYVRRQIGGARDRLRRVHRVLDCPWGVEVGGGGAYALAFHGAPRFTGDLDVLARPTLDNAKRLLVALESFSPTVPCSAACRRGRGTTALLARSARPRDAATRSARRQRTPWSDERRLAVG